MIIPLNLPIFVHFVNLIQQLFLQGKRIRYMLRHQVLTIHYQKTGQKQFHLMKVAHMGCSEQCIKSVFSYFYFQAREWNHFYFTSAFGHGLAYVLLGKQARVNGGNYFMAW